MTPFIPDEQIKYKTKYTPMQKPDISAMKKPTVYPLLSISILSVDSPIFSDMNCV